MRFEFIDFAESDSVTGFHMKVYDPKDSSKDIATFTGDPERFGGIDEIRRRMLNLETLHQNSYGETEAPKPYLGRPPEWVHTHNRGEQ